MSRPQGERSQRVRGHRGWVQELSAGAGKRVLWLRAWTALAEALRSLPGIQHWVVHTACNANSRGFDEPLLASVGTHTHMAYVHTKAHPSPIHINLKINKQKECIK